MALSSASPPPALLADTLTITSTALATTTLSPSSDTVTMDAGSATFSGPGSVTFQTGNFFVGNSPIADQVIPFFFNEDLTLNGITQTITIYGQDDVTNAADILTIFAQAPVNFGAYSLSLNGSSYTGVDLYQNLPLNLTADVSAQTPEPASLLLLATGLVGAAMVTTRLGRTAPRL